ncbi:MAG: hypothetical protein KatS3mg005_1968 [Bryobacteraceae bacterium]|nr:MAG: hypothetical protein KatS3mg005_1968 [Bryobacteraceae bacterium]
MQPEEKIRAVREELARLLSSPQFQQTPRVSAFLRLAVEMALEGRAGEIKEYVIATEVYQRGVDFDPKLDSIVRVEATRLRARLDEYYQDLASPPEVRIELPKGAYVPLFRFREEETAAEEPPAAVQPPSQSQPRVARRIWLAGAAAGSAAALWAGWRVWRNSAEEELALLHLGTGQSQSGDAADRFRLALAHELGRRRERFSISLTGSLQELHPGGGQTPAGRYGMVLSGMQHGPEEKAVLVAEAGATATEITTLAVWGGLESVTGPGGAAAFARRLAEALQKSRDESRRIPEAARSLYAEVLAEFRKGQDSLLLTAREIEQGWPLADLLSGVARMERVAAMAPSFAAAHAQLAWLNVLGAAYDPRLFARARESAERAVALDTRIWKAHFNLGYVRFFRDWQFTRAAESFRAAMQAAPLRLEQVRYFSDSQAIAGRADEAAAFFGVLTAVLPGHRLAAYAAAMLQYHRGNYPEMLRHSRRILEKSPEDRTGAWIEALALEQTAGPREALRRLEPLVAAEPDDHRAAAALAHALFRAGESSRAREVAARCRLDRMAYLRALMAAGRGDTPAALSLLEESLAKREIALAWFRVDPRFAEQRATARGRELLARIGLAA